MRTRRSALARPPRQCGIAPPKPCSSASRASWGKDDLTPVVAILLVVGAMALVISAIVGALNTGVITVGRTGKIGRQDAPFVFWLVILISVGVLVLCAVYLIRMQLH